MNLDRPKIRIMQITHDLEIGGLQQVIVNICRTINRELFDISVLCLRETGSFVHELEELGIKVIHLPQKQNRTDYFSFLKVAKILKQEGIEVLHTHNTQPFVDGTIGALLSGVKTIVHTDHARQFPDKRRYMFAEWLMSHFAYKVVGVSEHTSQNLIRYEKIRSDKVTTVTNGIDESKYNISIDKATKMRELGIDSGGPFIGLASRLIKGKGISHLLQAMTEIVNIYPNAILIIAGEGPVEEDLKKESSQLKLENNVVFLGPRLDINELLRLFDIYVLPSLSEGLPMGILEAMAAECPIVATDVGGIFMAISHGVNGSLIEAGFPSQLAHEILKLLTDDNLRNKYAQNAKKTFEEKFSAKIMTRKYEKLYKRLY